MREASITRETLETRVKVWISLDGSGKVGASTGIGFLDHMLETMLYYAKFDARVEAEETRSVGGHHVAEDVGLVLGDAIREALYQGAYARFGYAIVPMDEALALAAVDISGRPVPVIERLDGSVGGVPLEDLAHMVEALAWRLKASIHLMALRRGNRHHTIEAMFKALGMALGAATRPREGTVSLKGVLEG
ncbi:MAG: imidazoleglycerol-phosphate dehydratase [Desulfurococcales archaeon]|nr:imidazoleglycerol-phosphate dehydratase [Desulfurococcales archaeon]